MVSIVTVVRNGRRFLAQAIESVAAQTYPNLEYIVIDGASEDGTVELLRTYSKWIHHWASGPDQGIYDAMNKGISLASGRYVKLVNADDFLPPDSVARAVAAFRTNPDGVCLDGEVALVSRTGEALGLIPRRPGQAHSFPSFLHPSWYLPRSVYEAIGLYRTDLQVASDYDYFLRLCAARIEFVHVSEPPLIYFRSGGVSSQWLAVPEVFQVTLEHKGIWHATCAAATVGWSTTRSRTLRRFLGEGRFGALRRAMR